MKEIEIFEDILDIEEKLNTDISSGLSRKAARARAAEGTRENTSFFVRKKRNFVSCFFGVVKMLPAAILTLVAIAAFFMGRTQLALAVLSTFISGSIVSGMLYLSAQRSSERMELYSNPTVRVLRDGKEYITDCRNVVVGDVIILRAGDYIPCDLCVVDSSGLCVSEILFDKEIGYADKEIEDGFNGEGRLFAGSFVKSGYAKAVALAVGDDVYMSRYIRAGALAKKNSDPIVIKRIYKYLSGFVFVLSVLALILAIVGMFTAKHVGILETFLMYLSLILSMTLISSPIAGRILLASMLKRASRGGRDADYAIIKNNKAIDILPNVTDVVICGLSGITDGEMYFSSMHLFGEHIESINMADPNSFIFECIYSYVKAKEESGVASNDEKSILDGLLCGLQRIKFDRDAADVKIKSLYFGASIEGNKVACVEGAEASFRVYLGDDFSFAEQCDYFRMHDGLCRPSEAHRLSAEKYIANAHSRGESVYAVVSEIDGEIILEGIVGLREGICESFSEIRNMLMENDISVSVALSDNSEYEKFYLRAAGFDENHVYISDKDSIKSLHSGCAYLGYTPGQYAEYITDMKARGRTVAVIGISDEYKDAYDAADVLVSYDNINYGSSNFRDSEIELRSFDGQKFSQRCSQKMRTVSDVIIGRGRQESGGLRGFVEAVKCAESFSFNYLQMMLLFIAVEVVLIFMTFMSFISGMSLISYPAILLLVVALVFFSVAAFSTFKSRSFISRKKMSMAYFKRQVVRKIVPPLVSSVVYFAIALYLDLSGYITDIAAIPLATTLGVIVTFVLSFGGSMRACIGKKIDMSDIKGFAHKEKSRGKLLNVAAMTLVLTSVVRMILTALLIPGMAIEYGYVGVCTETFILLGVYFATFALCALTIKLIRKIIKHK